MAGFVFALVVGSAFILVGRWIYANPKALQVASLHADPDSRFLRVGAKVFGVLAIFIGSYSTAVAMAGLVIREAVVTVSLGLVLAALSAWVLRPETQSGLTPATGQRTPRPTRGKLLIAVVLSLAALFTGAILVLIRFGEGRLVPLVSTIAALTFAAAIAAILWFPKRA